MADTDTLSQCLRLHPDDSVLVATAALKPGTQLDAYGVRVQDFVPSGHKLAARGIAEGEAVRKFGQIIGVATQAIAPGSHVHSHNLAMGSHVDGYEIGTEARALPPLADIPTFMGIRRPDGRVATRNYVALCATVNCSATVVHRIADALNRSGELEAYPNIDGVVAFAHGTGCGMAGTGEGADALERVLIGHATHPNVAAAIFVGLGCEMMQVARLAGKHGVRDVGRLHNLTIQDTGGTRRTIEQALAHIRAMLPDLNQVQREPIPAGELALALQCGGSDGYSGITANPALGHAADLLVRCGGTAVLAETPEIYGAEHLLVRRAVARDVGEKLLERIAWWRDYTARNGAEMDNNPSPGNKAGGLTTILEKSLGAAAKGGSSPLVDVLAYAAPINARGFVFMDSPGYDPVSVTGQIATGCQLVAFTTGRGSAFGSKPAPTLKLSTNSATYERMDEDMDINCGDVVDQGVSIEAKGGEIFNALLELASGKKSKSEAQGLGDHEFIPWQIGAVL
ncbi:MAG: UxaA family hydrolase [Geminicoccaceae bacterium]